MTLAMVIAAAIVFPVLVRLISPDRAAWWREVRKLVRRK